ncbi:MAG: leucine--tRNA ligase [Phycisphaerales bacterium]
MSEPTTSCHAQSPSSRSRPPEDSPPFRYNAGLANEIEIRWQAYWDAHQTFRAPNPGEPGFDGAKPKFYVLDMFPYPSGAGLHVGHPEGYTASDIVSRFMRMKGHNVLHPMGWDAFGLPAEQYAIQTGVHPAVTTRKAIDNFRRQLKRFGFSYDWSREFGTIDPEYYRWTQWIFLRLYNAWYDPDAPNRTRGKGRARPISDLLAGFERGEYGVGPSGQLVRLDVTDFAPALSGSDVGVLRWHQLTQDQRRRFIDDQRLAYLGETTVNWCPALGTVLANDEVIDGKSERGGHPVLRKPLKQWMFRITAYAERLLADLALVDWPESTKAMQSEWIGKSEGAEIRFEVLGVRDSRSNPDYLSVFTTRPDTIFGATYMVVAPEHPLVKAALGRPGPETDAAALRAYVDAAKNRSEVDRMADAKDKTGVFTGLYCTNPATGRPIPVWTADYVLMGYGTGAIMAVPAHDERDFDFARGFKLPIRDVVYSRTHAAMKHFVENATRAEQSGDNWRSVLADFLGLCTTSSAEPSFFPEVLEAVRTRRTQAPPPTTTAGAPPVPRGSISGEYISALERFESFDALRAIFDDSALYSSEGAAFTGSGYAANSANAEFSINGLGTAEAKRATIDWLEKSGIGVRKINYKLRDWAFSRQRYWGEPFPIVYDEAGHHYPVSEKALPVTLPDLADYSPVESDDPQPLLAKATGWVRTTAGEAGVDPALLPPDTPVRRETNTMPGSAGSSWYFLRYCDARSEQRFVGREAEQYWMMSRRKSATGSADSRADEWRDGVHHAGGVDLYIGGSEHAVGHLLYSRFWQKALFDLGETSTPEPFGRLFHQGMITSFAYQRPDKSLVPCDEVEERAEGEFVERGKGTRLTQIVAKMSKSLKNVVNPDDIIAQFGADTFRLYEMYMGPLAASKPWNTKDAVGIYRFLQRAWRLVVDEQTGALRTVSSADPQVEKLLHRTIHKVEHDTPKLAFNTAIAAMIEFVNAATSSGGLTREQIRLFTLTLAPYAPHLGEELWHKLGNAQSLAHETFPTPDPGLLVDDTVELPVQIAGKVKAKVHVPTGAGKDQIERLAMADPAVQAAIAGKTVQKVVVVPGKMVSIVVN